MGWSNLRSGCFRCVQKGFDCPLLELLETNPNAVCPTCIAADSNGCETTKNWTIESYWEKHHPGRTPPGKPPINDKLNKMTRKRHQQKTNSNAPQAFGNLSGTPATVGFSRASDRDFSFQPSGTGSSANLHFNFGGGTPAQNPRQQPQQQPQLEETPAQRLERLKLEGENRRLDIEYEKLKRSRNEYGDRSRDNPGYYDQPRDDYGRDDYRPNDYRPDYYRRDDYPRNTYEHSSSNRKRAQDQAGIDQENRSYERSMPQPRSPQTQPLQRPRHQPQHQGRDHCQRNQPQAHDRPRELFPNQKRNLRKAGLVLERLHPQRAQLLRNGSTPQRTYPQTHNRSSEGDDPRTSSNGLPIGTHAPAIKQETDNSSARSDRIKREPDD